MTKTLLKKQELEVRASLARAELIGSGHIQSTQTDRKMKLWETWTDGWTCDIGKISGDLTLSMCLDRYVGSNRHFWIGFFLKKDPRGEDWFSAWNKVDINLFGDDHFKHVEKGSSSHDKLKKHLVGAAFERPSLEMYENDNDFYFGKYLRSFDLDEIKDFVSACIDYLPKSYGREGRRLEYVLSKWERDPKLRAKCLQKFGYECAVCEAKLSDTYGPLAENYIHVHHLTPGFLGERLINAETDLVPVCPNCHAMLHKDGLKTPDDLKKIRKQALLSRMKS